MRTVCLVIALSLFGALGTACAQEAPPAPDAAIGAGAGGTGAGDMDRQITVRGQDDTALPLPSPPESNGLTIPDADFARPDTQQLPPIPPPAGTSAAPPPEWRVRDPAGASSS